MSPAPVMWDALAVMFGWIGAAHLHRATVTAWCSVPGDSPIGAGLCGTYLGTERGTRASGLDPYDIVQVLGPDACLNMLWEQS